MPAGGDRERHLPTRRRRHGPKAREAGAGGPGRPGRVALSCGTGKGQAVTRTRTGRGATAREDVRRRTMRRRTFDALATAAGLLIAGLLLVAGGLLTWGHTFV